MGLGNKYVSSYGGKSERMVEMIGSRGAVRWLSFSKWLLYKLTDTVSTLLEH